MIVILDIPQDNQADFVKFCQDNGLDIADHTQVGPAGGCPRYVLIVDERSKMDLVSSYYFG